MKHSERRKGKSLHRETRLVGLREKSLHRKVLLLALLLLVSLQLAAQSLAVKSFRALPNDLTANSYGTTVTDQNGEVCALIKVVTTQTGFTFDIGSLGVTDVKQTPGEVWVYVPRGAKRITIKHPKLGVLRDYYFNTRIDGGQTYELVLASGTMETVVREDIGGQHVVITVEPRNAVVRIDGEDRENIGGTVSCFLPYGSHQYTVSAPMYDNTAALFEVGEERVDLNVKLTYAYDPVTVNVPEGSTLYIDNERKGTGLWEGRLPGGLHVLEARREGHRPYSQSITVEKHTPPTITLNAPTPVYGDINVTTVPLNATVAIDGKELGKSPNIFRNVLTGHHQLKFSLKGYADKTVAVTVEEGKVATVNAQLEKATAVQSATRPASRSGQSWLMAKPEKWQFLVGANVAFPEKGMKKPAFGLTIGIVKNWGFYVRAFYSAGKDGFKEVEDNAVGNYALTGNYTHQYMSAVGGVMLRLYGPLYVNAGGGIAKNKVSYEVSNQPENFNIILHDHNGDISGVAELGVSLRLGNLLISGGSQANFVGGMALIPYAGIGYCF